MTTYSPGLGASGGGAPVVIVDANGDQATVTDGRLDVNASVSITGGATEAKQDSQIVLATTLNALIETLQELDTRLTAIASTVANTAQLRTIGTAVVSGSVTATGGGYITSAQSIAEKAVAGISYPEKMAITNLTATQANINNTTI